VNEDRSHTIETEEQQLFAWVEAVCAGPIIRSSRVSGGNRARSWALDVSQADGKIAELYLRYSPPRPPSVEPYTLRREALVYRAIADAGLTAPRLIAEHPSLTALLTDRAKGIAEFRRLKDVGAKTRITAQFMKNLARLHAMDASGVSLEGGVASSRIIDHVRAELAVWRAMYEETGRRDPLIEFAFAWLHDAPPDPADAPVLVHGDAGPGNFLFDGDRLTAVIDWELAHLGDPMEDLAWFSMRCVMEPTPDFTGALRAYATAAGRKLDRARILYHRVFVSTRVVVIRHRNVTGEPGASIVSRALNRRLLVQALSEASGAPVDVASPPVAAPTERDALYARIADDLQSIVGADGVPSVATSAAKNASKILKYLRAFDGNGANIEAAELGALRDLLRSDVADLANGRARLADLLARGAIPFKSALAFFARQSTGEALLAAEASGGIAKRGYPAITPEALA